MTTRSFTPLDHRKYGVPQNKNKIPKGTYVPAQPVLSCRTFNIDLPGTRTYRHKSNLDILEEHQRLVRHLCSKPRISNSAPPRERKVPSPRPPSQHSARKCYIEVKGRPLTSGSTASSHQSQGKVTSVSESRAKTTGHKNIRSLTDYYIVLGEDEDLSAISQSSHELKQRLHSYWKADKNILSTGKFLRNQKGPEDGSTRINSWLSFGRSAGESSQGVINAFASFTNSKEFYNIEGSIGSRVAKQLQNGNTIRIGINGELQTQDFKVNKWSKDNISPVPPPFVPPETRKHAQREVPEEPHSRPETAATAWTIMPRTRGPATEETKKEELVIDVPFPDSDLDEDFSELVISSFDDYQESSVRSSGPKPVKPKLSKMSADPTAESPMSSEEEVVEALKLTTPLSWSDQCSKSNIKIIRARDFNKETLKPVVSETFPVKFEKLFDGISRPKLAELRADSHTIKQRYQHNNDKNTASKVKVVYATHTQLPPDEDNAANQLSVEEIISHKLEEKRKENPAHLLMYDIKDNNDEPINMNNEQIIPFQPTRASSSKSEPRMNFSAFYNSLLFGRSDSHISKLRVSPVHSSADNLQENLRILSAGSQLTKKNKDLTKTGRVPGKLTPVKPLHQTVASQGSSIKSGLQQGERKYINITSQLKMTPINTPVINLSHRSTIFNLSQAPAGRSTPQDPDYQFMDKIILKNESPEDSTAEPEVKLTKIVLASKKPVHTPAVETNISVDDDDEDNEDEDPPREPESPAPSSAPISIPTADEEYFCQSLSTFESVDER